MIQNPSIFSRQEINTGRQPELDLLKSVTIFLMIFGHIAEIIFSHQWEDFAFCNLTLFWQIVFIIINMVSAFGFMFSMGASIPFSRHQEAGIWIRRGFKLILAWFVLKLFYVYPIACLFAEAHEMSTLQFSINTIASNDILFFAGSFFLFIGCLRKMKFNLTGTVLAAIGLFTLGHFISYDSSSSLMQYILGNFIITEEAVFPFLNWIMAPVLGMCWGTMLRHCANKDRLYLWTGIAGLIGTGAVLLISGMKGMLSLEEIQKLCDIQIFYEANILTVTVACCFLALLLSLYYAVVRIVKAHWFEATYSYLSKQLTNIYFAQWVIIPWLALCLPRPKEKVNMWWLVLMAVLILCISTFFADIYTRIKNKRSNDSAKERT